MSGIWMYGDRTVDGRALTPQERDARPLVGAVDEPPTHDVVSRDPRVCRFRGWVASAADLPTKVVVRIDGGPPLEFDADRARPEVAEAVELAGPARGFHFYVDLPEDTGGAVPVVLELTDGEVIAQTDPFHVRLERVAKPPRAAYGQVWDSVSEDLEHAKLAVSGFTDEDTFALEADKTVRRLQRTVGIGREDVVLEIGAGVGRVGSVLAPLCKKWIATDASENMLRHTRERLADFDNVETVPTNGWDLKPIPSECVDVVYCTVVFMHLDEWERFNYVREAMRVLRPGGRVYIDNFNLLGAEGWGVFRQVLDDLHPLDRPPNVSKASTPQELETYLVRAGFADVVVAGETLWVYAYGQKT
ncbi:MAG: class I SAM-dependent methyltransferase [Acidimicrobiia bacterium]